VRLILAISLVFLTACQSWHDSSENSPFYPIPVGSRLILKQPLSIPADRASVYIQRGQIVPYNGRDTYYANCKFELNTLKPVAQTVDPDEFTVSKVTQYIRLNQLYEPGQMYAQISGKGDVSSKLYAWIIYLRSSRQPDVLRMTCGRWDYRGAARQLAIQEIRDTLGNLFTLQLSAGG